MELKINIKPYKHNLGHTEINGVVLDILPATRWFIETFTTMYISSTNKRFRYKAKVGHVGIVVNLTVRKRWSLRKFSLTFCTDKLLEILNEDSLERGQVIYFDKEYRC